MKTGLLLTAAVGVAGLIAILGQPKPEGTNTSAPDAVPSAADPNAPSAPAVNPSLSGQVKEAIDVAQYTYLRLSTAQGEAWAAVSKATVAVGSNVSIADATRMDHFESPTLKRTFDVIYFGNLQGAAEAAPEPDFGPDLDPETLPPGHPPIGAGTAVPGNSEVTQTAPLPQVAVKPAVGENAATIASLFADRAKLAGGLVRVRGQVVKATLDVQGKNYFRLRDDSGGLPEQRELVVASAARATRGDVVTFEGTVRTNVDLGIGFTYPVLLEDAHLAQP